MCQSASQQEIATELRLTRTILERMECSFARQEAKLDQLLNLLTTKQTVDLPTSQPSQNHQQPVQQFSTPVPSQLLSTVPLSTPMSAGGPSRSLEIPTPMLFQQTPLVDLDRLLDDPELAGNISSYNIVRTLVLSNSYWVIMNKNFIRMAVHNKMMCAVSFQLQNFRRV